jgi:hypothetical protein
LPAYPLVVRTGRADQGDWHGVGVDEVAESRLDRFRGDGLFGDLNHAGSFTLTNQ